MNTIDTISKYWKVGLRFKFHFRKSKYARVCKQIRALSNQEQDTPANTGIVFYNLFTCVSIEAPLSRRASIYYSKTHGLESEIKNVFH